jgi:pyruvate dehydrogenase E1 component alpha subunit
VLDTYAATRLAADLVRSGGGPAIVFAETFRMGGHATHDEKEAREMFSSEVFEYWGKRDPIGLYEAYLELRGVRHSTLEEAEDRVIQEIQRAEQEALTSREKDMPQPSTLTQGVYAESDGA